MLRIHEICVKKEKDSSVNLSNVKSCIEYVMQKNASSIPFKVTLENEELKVILQDSISILTAYKFLIAFDEKRIRIRQANAKREDVGPFKRGLYEVIVF